MIIIAAMLWLLGCSTEKETPPTLSQEQVSESLSQPVGNQMAEALCRVKWASIVDWTVQPAINWGANLKGFMERNSVSDHFNHIQHVKRIGVSTLKEQAIVKGFSSIAHVNKRHELQFLDLVKQNNWSTQTQDYLRSYLKKTSINSQSHVPIFVNKYVDTAMKCQNFSKSIERFHNLDRNSDVDNQMSIASEFYDGGAHQCLMEMFDELETLELTRHTVTEEAGLVMGCIPVVSQMDVDWLTPDIQVCIETASNVDAIENCLPSNDFVSEFVTERNTEDGKFCNREWLKKNIKQIALSNPMSQGLRFLNNEQTTRAILLNEINIDGRFTSVSKKVAIHSTVGTNDFANALIDLECSKHQQAYRNVLGLQSGQSWQKPNIDQWGEYTSTDWFQCLEQINVAFLKIEEDKFIKDCLISHPTFERDEDIPDANPDAGEGAKAKEEEGKVGRQQPVKLNPIDTKDNDWFDLNAAIVQRETPNISAVYKGQPQRDLGRYSPSNDSWVHHCNEPNLPQNISASSELSPQGKNNYRAINISDDKSTTSWVEGDSGYGIGEYVEMDFNVIFPNHKTIYLLNGYQKNAKSWSDNSRVKSMMVSIDGTDIAKVSLADKMGIQTITLPTIPIQSGRLRLTILEVYEGSKYKDTAITEIYSCRGLH